MTATRPLLLVDLQPVDPPTVPVSAVRPLSVSAARLACHALGWVVTAAAGLVVFAVLALAGAAVGGLVVLGLLSAAGVVPPPVTAGLLLAAVGAAAAVRAGRGRRCR